MNLPASPRTRVVIMGAAGRDFHDFNTVFRDSPAHEVVAFTAAQIPQIAGRCYPPALAGPLYPTGIPVLPEQELEQLIDEHRVEQVVFSYSDLSHQQVMRTASLVQAAGASFVLLGPQHTELPTVHPE